MTDIEVRTPAPDDWELLRDLRLEALRDSPEAFSSSVSRETAFEESLWRSRTPTAGVAFRDGEPVGLVGWHRPDDAEHFELVSMWVRADARGSDVATRLVEFVVLAVSGAPLALGVVRDNDRAHAFYTRVGFVDDGAEIGAVTGQDLIRMRYGTK